MNLEFTSFHLAQIAAPPYFRLALIPLPIIDSALGLSPPSHCARSTFGAISRGFLPSWRSCSTTPQVVGVLAAQDVTAAFCNICYLNFNRILFGYQSHTRQCARLRLNSLGFLA